MANKNKNTNELVDHSDEDATSELEITEVFRNRLVRGADKIEVDEHTYDIADADIRLTDKSKVELKSALKKQKAKVEALEFEFEKAETRRRSLEEEVIAFKEIAETFSAQALQSQRERTETDAKLTAEIERSAELQQSLEEMGAAIDDARSSAGDARAKADAAIDKSRELKHAVDDSRKQLLALEKTVTMREKSVAKLRTKLRKSKEQKQPLVETTRIAKLQLSEMEKELSAARTEVASLSSYIDARQEEWEPRNSQLAELTSELADERETAQILRQDLDKRTRDNEALRQQLESATEQLERNQSELNATRAQNLELDLALNEHAAVELDQNRVLLAEQEGQLAAWNARIEELEKDNLRLEKYADSLRGRLQDQLTLAGDAIAIREVLESRLEKANQKMLDLSTRVQAEKERADVVETRNKEMEENFEREVRQIRFELSSAQDTLSDKETLAEELASDLVDHRSFRQALEAQLGEIEEQSDTRIRRLSKDLKRAVLEVQELERKIKMKDQTIGDLMRELASHSDQEVPAINSDSGLQRIEGFRSEESPHRQPAEKDRIARLLVGKADGRELRFPLFKDRLTIGRTSHNDIQLNMQYVSRRHAVLSTDDGKTRVIDWGSRNGVFVNSKRVTEKILASGDVVTIGTTEFRYEERNKR